LNSHDTEKSLILTGENPVAEVPDRNLRSPGQLKNKLSNVWHTHMLCVLHVAPAMGCFLVRGWAFSAHTSSRLTCSVEGEFSVLDWAGS
jgi:hypothetical protein